MLALRRSLAIFCGVKSRKKRPPSASRRTNRLHHQGPSELQCPDDLELEAETNRDDRVNFEQRQTVVNSCLLGVNLTLDDGVACDWAAIDARGIANVPSQIKCRLRRSLECNADFKRNAKALAAAGNQIAPAHRHRRGGTSEVDLPAARNRRCGITEESFAS